jgi:hypothetical protein
MNKDRSKKIKDIVQKSIDERTKILGKRHYGHFVNEDEDNKKKDKKGKKPHHGVPPPPPNTNSPFENAISASYGGTEEGGAVSVTADQDAVDFIFKVGITDPNQQLAIEDLVSELKAIGVWERLQAIYPFVGNIADTCKYNLKDPRNVKDAFRITWNGSPTFAPTGVTGGAGKYGNTWFSTGDFASQDDVSMHIYTRGAFSDAYHGAWTDMGLYEKLGAVTYRYLQFDIGNSAFQYWYGAGLLTSVNAVPPFYPTPPNPDQRGFFSMNRESNVSLKGYRNGIQPGAPNTIPLDYFTEDEDIFVLARNNEGTHTGSNSSRELAFAAIGQSLTDAEVSDLYTVVQNFQTTLGREV